MAKATTTKHKNLNDFRLLHDKSLIVPAKIKAQLARMGKDAWEYEADFLRAAGVRPADLTPFREQFEDFTVMTPGKNPKRVWVGSKAMAEKMREMLQ